MAGKSVESPSTPLTASDEKMTNNKVADFDREDGKHNLAQEGPIKNRGCTDVLCLLLFIAFVAGWIVIGVYAFANGNPLKLVYPSDSQGNICGSSSLVDRPHLLFFDLTKCLKPSSAAFGCPTKQVCVKSCPNSVLSFWALAKVPSKPPLYMESLIAQMEPFCDPELFKSTPASQEHVLDMISKQVCPAWVLPSSSFLGRCIPFLTYGNGTNITASDNILNSNDTPNDQGITVEVLKEKIGNLIEILNLRTYGEKVLSDLSSSWWIILLAIIMASFVSFIWIILMRFIAAVMVWSSLLLSVGLLGLSCVYCGFQFAELYGTDEQGLDFGGFQFTTDFGSYLDLAITWMVFLVISGIALLVVLLLICFMWSRIKIAIELIEEASIAVGDMMSTLFFPIIPFLLEVVFVAWFLVVAAYLSSWNEQRFHWNIDDSAECEITNGTKIKDGQKCTNQSLVYTCDNGKMAHCQFERYGPTTEGSLMQIYNLFGFFWGLFFLEALDQMVLAGAFASWYWVLDKRDVPKLPLLASFSRTLRYHLGTLAFGSLIIAIIRMIRVMIEYIEEKLKEYHQDNPVVKCMICFCKCCFYCLEKFMKFLNRNAYIMTAVYGKNFCWSAKEAFMLLFRNIARVFVLDKVTDFLLLLGKLVIVGGVGILSFYVFSGRLNIEEKTGAELPQLNYYFVPIIIITLSTYFIADIFFGVYEMGVDTLFLCFLEDIERNDGSAEKPYFMSKDLKKILGYMEDKSRPNSAE